ncbi:serine/threonine-protein kinase [Actinocorallia populi]|uniref:serine/threonine-protein kinase n=1 Tax=Actinocorallia populi TaxID=2079200 RepID=UPI001E4ACB9C|nr:serine/threonine-protein kinase [Actinocorallia populi]
MVETRPLRAGDPASIGSYTLVGVLGEGGQGTVYLGERDGMPVAVKLLHARFAEDDEARGRFVRELEVAKQVARFCTAQVLDADVEGDRPYIVSEFVPGISLQEQVETEGPRTDGALERLAINTLNALTAIHQAGIIHRDLKPHNVLIGPDGPRVIDFGIARALNVTSHSHSIGTPAYMSPEQLNGHQLTAASDLFSWASCMVFAATGTPPFGSDEIGAVVYRIAHAEADTGALPTPLREVVQACLAKDPAARPTAAQAQSMLMGGTGAQPVLQPQPPIVPPSPPAPQTVVTNPAEGAQAWAPQQPQPPQQREPYPFEIGPKPGESDALAGRRPTIAIVIFIIMLLSIGVTGWALTRDDEPKKSDEVTGLAPQNLQLTVSAQPSRPTASSRPTDKPGSTDKEPRPEKTVVVTVTPSAPDHDKPGPSAPPSPSDGATQPPAPAPSTPPVVTAPPQPSPSPTRTVERNPYGAVQVCNGGGRGGGFQVQRSRNFPGGRTVQLYNAAGFNCVVTLKTADLDRKTGVFARLVRQSDRRSAVDRGMYQFYAGPVYLAAKGTCVRFAGGGPAGSVTAPWANCR